MIFLIFSTEIPKLNMCPSRINIADAA
jgi:hypothetical protein